VIDSFSLGITHFLMLLTCWYLLKRPDTDREDGGETGFRPKKPRDG
jgi:hypothetical protein